MLYACKTTYNGYRSYTVVLLLLVLIPQVPGTRYTGIILLLLCNQSPWVSAEMYGLACGGYENWRRRTLRWGTASSSSPFRSVVSVNCQSFVASMHTDAYHDTSFVRNNTPPHQRHKFHVSHREVDFELWFAVEPRVVPGMYLSPFFSEGFRRPNYRIKKKLEEPTRRDSRFILWNGTLLLQYIQQ